MKSFPNDSKMCCAEIIQRSDNGSYVVETYFESAEKSGSICIEASYRTWNISDADNSYWVFLDEGRQIDPPQSFIDWHNSDRPEFDFL